MTKLAFFINNLYQKIKRKQLTNTSIVLLVSLGTYVLFHQLLLEKFDEWITEPILSTITSNILLDTLWLFFLILIFRFAINPFSTRFFHSTNWLLLGIFYTFNYLYFRFFFDHYSFVGFQLWNTLKYADVFAMMPFVFAIGLYSKPKRGSVAVKDAELIKVQRMIKSYLNLETNYALLLNGKRGTGKTHFVKNRLLDQIKVTLPEESSTKPYIPIYISLYGIKSIDEVYLHLSMSLTPHLGKHPRSGDSYLAKILLRGILSITRAGNIDDYLKDYEKLRKNSLIISEFVIIFDDLDRISKDLTIEELIGFINTIVEHDNNKVIIVADELEIEKQGLYKQVREKTIGSIVEYPANFNIAFEEIVQSKYSSSAPAFYEHLKTVKLIIYNQFQSGNCVNLRTLIYFLNHYKKVYESLDNKQKKDSRDIEVQQLKMQLTVKFTCATCIEFKSGIISYNSKNGINDMLSINKRLTDDFTKQMWQNAKTDVSNDAPDNIPIEEMEYPQQFVTKYFRTWEYQYLKSVYDFVTGGNELDEALLLSELNFIDDKITTVSDAEIVYNQLSAPQVFDLSNQEYLELNEKMLRHAENGDYPLQKYLNVFSYLLRFPDISKYQSTVILQRLTNGLKENQSKYLYDSGLDFTLREDDDFSKSSEWKLLKNVLRDINNATEKLNEERRTENLYNLFISDPDEFYDRCFREFYNRPIFSSWDFTIFYSDFQKLKPSAIQSLTRFLLTRYKNAGNEKWVEKHFIESLINKLSSCSHQEVNFKTLLVDDLRAVLHEIHKTYTKISF